MTCDTGSRQCDLAMTLLIEKGFDGITNTVGLLNNRAMQSERSHSVGAYRLIYNDARYEKVRQDGVLQ